MSCVIVLVACGFFVFWVEHLLVRSDIDGGLRVCVMIQTFVVFLFCVGWLLVRCWVSGMTHVVVVPV
ncbi:Uncharacterised protein [Corynebacterium amycolatum]|nr:Uncharacterised protein [Corynebacterium amycolatum]